MSVRLKGLRRVRKEQGLSLRKLAEITGMGYPNLSRIERGQQEARPGTARKLARALGVDVKELMSAEGTGVPLGKLGSPLDQARFRAMRLERREEEAEGKGDAWWMRQWVAADQGVDNMTKLLRQVDADPLRRREALDLLERFIALERRAEEQYFALHGWKLPRDAVSQETLAAEDRETTEANA